MLIQSLEQKTKLAMMTVIVTISGCVVICGFTLWCCMSLHDGGEGTYPALPPVLFQLASR